MRIVSVCVNMCSTCSLRLLTVVGTADNPWQLVVEEDSADIVQMAVQSEQTSPSLI